MKQDARRAFLFFAMTLSFALFLYAADFPPVWLAVMIAPPALTSTMFFRRWLLK